jgi:small subunit ribosomal protein S16
MQRLGRTHRPFYRIAAAEKRVKRDGKVLENLGWYNPIEKDPEKQLKLNAERIQYWLGVGAQPSDTVMDILGKQDLLTPKLKEKWESKREADRNRVSCKVAVSTAEKAQAEVGKLNADGVDMAGYTATIGEALKEAKAAVSAADPKAADAARSKAEGALNDAKSAVEKAQAQKKAAEEAEARKKAEEEAASAAAAPAEGGEGEEKPAEG